MNYNDLVVKRKMYKVSFEGFLNQSKIEDGAFDVGNYLDPWGQWQSSMPADILVVGQDWGSQKYYNKNNGKDILSNSTCSNIVKLFSSIGIDIGSPEKPIGSKIHFVNIIPFVRVGAMQGNKNQIVNDEVIRECVDEFLRPLFMIIKPRIVITLGSFPFTGISYLLSLKKLNKPFTAIVEESPIIESGVKIFPMFHCGAMSTNLNRKFDKQLEDWNKLKSEI